MTDTLWLEWLEVQTSSFQSKKIGCRLYEGSTKVHPKDLNLVFLGPAFALGPG